MNQKDFILTENVLSNSTAVWDVFLDKFDITWAFGHEWENSNKELTITPVEQLQNVKHDDGSIKYKYNNEWFRSDDFTNIHNSKYHVLFGGCSETEGIASPIEEVWSKMLYEDLKNKYDIDGFYSIARSGFGWQKVILNFMIYVEKYGFPTHFFILLPNLGRFFKWDEEQETWRYVQKAPPTEVIPPKDRNFFNDVTTPLDHKGFLINFLVSWKLFEKYCEANNVKLLCSTWDYLEGQNIDRVITLKSFFRMSSSEVQDYIQSVRPDGKLNPGDLKRRDGHSGKLIHEYWLKSFEEEIESRGLFDD